MTGVETGKYLGSCRREFNRVVLSCLRFYFLLFVFFHKWLRTRYEPQFPLSLICLFGVSLHEERWSPQSFILGSKVTWNSAILAYTAHFKRHLRGFRSLAPWSQHDLLTTSDEVYLKLSREYGRLVQVPDDWLARLRHEPRGLSQRRLPEPGNWVSPSLRVQIPPFGTL